MAWCRQATSHCMKQCWPRSMSPYGVTRPQWVKAPEGLNVTYWLPVIEDFITVWDVAPDGSTEASWEDCLECCVSWGRPRLVTLNGVVRRPLVSKNRKIWDNGISITNVSHFLTWVKTGVRNRFLIPRLIFGLKIRLINRKTGINYLSIRANVGTNTAILKVDMPSHA